MSFLTKLPRERYSPDAFAGFTGGDDFTPGDGKAFSWMSQLAYETDEPAKIADVLSMWGLALVDGGVIEEEDAAVLARASTHAFVAERPQATFVTFAGTDPVVLANWITNFDALRSASGIARGFDAAAEIVWPTLRPLLARAATQGRKVFVSGHSLGGALAALIAWRMSRGLVADPPAVYTFGMPRIGDAAFADAYNARLGRRTFRLVHGEDLVPTVGPSGLGFRHVGRYLHCGRGAKFDAGLLAADTASDEPQFTEGVSRDVADFLRQPLARVMSAAERLRLAAELAVGRGPAGMRTDPGGIAIELLPPRLRDHMPDRYIGGF